MRLCKRLMIVSLVFVLFAFSLANASGEASNNDDLFSNSSEYTSEQLVYLAVLLASGMSKGPQELNVLPLRGACNFTKGAITENYSIISYDNNTAQIRYIYSFGGFACLTLMSETVDKDSVSSSRNYPGSIPEGETDDQNIPFSSAQTVSCTLTIASPFADGMLPDATLVIFDEAAGCDWSNLLSEEPVIRIRISLSEINEIKDFSTIFNMFSKDEDVKIVLEITE